MITSNFNPNWASPPVETIKRVLNKKGICFEEFSSNIELTQEQITGLISGTIRINKSLAQKFEQYLGGSSAFWLKRDEQYVSQLKGVSIQKEEDNDWINILPISEMIRFGWIDNTENLIQSCLDFFAVKSKTEWENQYEKMIAKSMFRTSSSFNEEIGALSVWLRRGEVIANKIQCSCWNAEKLEKSIPELRKLTRIKSPKEFLPKLIEICSSAGVAISIVRAPKGCRSSGVTRFVNKDKAILQLSFRYLVDDHFWFTFFHELGHLIMHGKEKLFLEHTSNKERFESDEELEANFFAQAALIPNEYEGALKTMRRDKRTIIKFSSELGISPGILIGQLQHRKIIKFEYLNSYKRRYNWEEISESLLY